LRSQSFPSPDVPQVNGKPLTGEIALSHKDRILFGSNHLYVFVNPKIPKSSSATPADITWEFAQGEIAQAKGYDVGTEGLTRDQQRAQEQVLELLPLLGEANALRLVSRLEVSNC
jgi:hypothetical protein